MQIERNRTPRKHQYRMPYENYLWHTPKPYSGNGLEVVSNIGSVKATEKTLKDVATWHRQRKTRRHTRIAEIIETEIESRKS